jgi:hypothetical protein
MQKPLTGNLALNFMFKDQDLANIIKIKAAKTDDVRQSTTFSSAGKNASGSKMQDPDFFTPTDQNEEEKDGQRNT